VTRERKWSQSLSARGYIARRDLAVRQSLRDEVDDLAFLVGGCADPRLILVAVAAVPHDRVEERFVVVE
jgi:hypothetical protein